MSLSIKSCVVSTPSSYSVLIIMVKSTESANQARNNPPITQNLNTKTYIIDAQNIQNSCLTTSVRCLSNICKTESSGFL